MVAPKDAPSTADGTGYESGKKNTHLQRHVAFFDQDNDGIIWPFDTYVGFRDLKFGILFSTLAMFVIHSGFSYVTWGSWIPDPFFRLKINRMHRGKHGSDSEVFNSTGEFDKDRFENVFNMYSVDPHTHITFWQGVRMVHGNLNAFDPFGWTAAVFEWMATYIMIWPDDPKGIAKQDIMDIYDGSLFDRISGRKSEYETEFKKADHLRT